MGDCSGEGDGSGGKVCDGTQGQVCCVKGRSCATGSPPDDDVTCEPDGDLCGTTNCPPSENTCLDGQTCCPNAMQCNGQCLSCASLGGIVPECGGVGDICGNFLACGGACPSGFTCTNYACVPVTRCKPPEHDCSGVCVPPNQNCD